MDKPKLPRLFHLLRECPNHSWVEGTQVTRVEFRAGNTAHVSNLDNDDFEFEDQDVDLANGSGSAKATDGYDCSVDFEIPFPVQVTNENWEKFLPLPSSN